MIHSSYPELPESIVPYSPDAIAALLLDINAITLNPNTPFTFASGIQSPIYCDNRLVISHVKEREQLIEAFLDTIEIQHLSYDVIAGTATAGIPHAAWIADRLKKPMVYVRSSAKGHGKQNKIEGSITAGQTALVIEDLISTGRSAVDAAIALKSIGAKVTDCIAIFSYQMPAALSLFSEQAIALHTLSDMNHLLHIAKKRCTLSDKDYRLIQQWQENPNGWRDL